MGVISFAAEAGVPMLAPVGTRRGAADDGAEEVGLQDHPERRPHCQRAGGADGQDQGQDGGFITINDPFGENWAKVFGELAPRTASRSWPTSATSAPIRR
jgi:branched-chain amino acid transport system substrate-binding protein